MLHVFSMPLVSSSDSMNVEMCLEKKMEISYFLSKSTPVVLDLDPSREPVVIYDTYFNLDDGAAYPLIDFADLRTVFDNYSLVRFVKERILQGWEIEFFHINDEPCDFDKFADSLLNNSGIQE